MKINPLEILREIGPYMETILISQGVIAFLLLLVSRSRQRLRVPGGKGFRNISLPLISYDKIRSVFAFKNLVRGTLVIAGAGSGKTKSIIEPLLRQTVKEKYSGIIYDFKFPVLANFLYRETLLTGDNTIKYHYINFVDLRRSHRFNVFKSIKNSSYAQEYASSFMMNLLPESIKNPDFFLRTATALLSASILFFSKKHKHMCKLPHIMIFLLHSDIAKVVEIISSDDEAASIVASTKSGLSSDKQTAGVVSSLQNSLALCVNPNVFWVLSGDDFDLDLNNPTEPKLLVVGNNASLMNSISPLVSLIVTVASKQMNAPNKERSILLLDEGPTLFVPNFDTIPATGRENKIATIYCGQDIAQMEERYGEKKAEVLVANLSNQFYGKISNPKTAEKVVKLFGKREVEFESRSSNQSSHSNTSSSGQTRSLQQRDRVDISQLRELNPGEFVASTDDRKDFKVIFQPAPSEDLTMPELTYATEEMVQKNYAKIKAEVLRLFEKEAGE